MEYLDTFAVYPNRQSLLMGPLDDIQCLYKAYVYKSCLVSQY